LLHFLYMRYLFYIYCVIIFKYLLDKNLPGGILCLVNIQCICGKEAELENVGIREKIDMQNRKMTKTTHGVFMLPKTWIGKCVLPTVLMDKCRGSAMISRWGQHTRCCSRPSCTHSVKLLLNFILFYFLKKLMPSIINLCHVS